MGKGRLEAFSDGVIAVAITIMVLDLKAPTHNSLEGLREVWPTFLWYILSFLYVGIYWNNHHHLLHAAERVSGTTLWANLHLLFWITLIPFVTGWAGESHFAALPTAAYGFVLLMASIAWQILRFVLVKCHGPQSTIGRALRRGRKEWFSTACYAAGILLASAGALAGSEHWTSLGGFALYVLVAAMWFVPDSRIESELRRS